MRGSVVALICTLTFLLVGGAAQGGCGNGACPGRIDCSKGKNEQVCRYTKHLKNNTKGDADHKVLASRNGTWSTRNGGGKCTVQVQFGRGRPFVTYRQGSGQTLELDAKEMNKIRVSDCRQGLWKIECKRNGDW